MILDLGNWVHLSSILDILLILGRLLAGLGSWVLAGLGDLLTVGD